MISFVVPCVPVAQPRQRHFIHRQTGRLCNAVKAAHPIHAFKASVRLAAQTAYSGPPLEGCLRLGVTFVFPRPLRLCRKKDPLGRIPFDAKPDADNLLKGLCDSLNELTWKDDRQICAALVVKEYAAIGEQPHVAVTIEPLEQRQKEIA